MAKPLCYSSRFLRATPNIVNRYHYAYSVCGVIKSILLNRAFPRSWLMKPSPLLYLDFVLCAIHHIARRRGGGEDRGSKVSVFEFSTDGRRGCGRSRRAWRGSGSRTSSASEEILIRATVLDNAYRSLLVSRRVFPTIHSRRPALPSSSLFPSLLSVALLPP